MIPYVIVVYNILNKLLPVTGTQCSSILFKLGICLSVVCVYVLVFSHETQYSLSTKYKRISTSLLNK